MHGFDRGLNPRNLSMNANRPQWVRNANRHTSNPQVGSGLSRKWVGACCWASWESKKAPKHRERRMTPQTPSGETRALGGGVRPGLTAQKRDSSDRTSRGVAAPVKYPLAARLAYKQTARVFGTGLFWLVSRARSAKPREIRLRSLTKSVVGSFCNCFSFITIYTRGGSSRSFFGGGHHRFWLNNKICYYKYSLTQTNQGFYSVRSQHLLSAIKKCLVRGEGKRGKNKGGWKDW